ncbi:RES domain protein (plasmid) [Deinococcus geothermalis DSM 11300]|uniref:RES domain protein n=1 Tax=Deinococcus geothermalis (strain DSM 11300 / CIP 105573 / AG-3a) TaxID=319795 RepID=A8ZRA8_DEIGD|nr:MULTISPECIES: RES family NAD+ phosphorylase [Deinococcus]ABW35017.1 RES domain protein [Deinococcus geothermalis DSM 11300]TDE84767.1 RES domain-containing protein [Deinococcus sp. S9]
MKRGDDLRAAIQAAPLLAQDTVTYRVTHLKYFETLTSSEGAYASDNRFTPKRLSYALYVADAPDLALREATQGYQDEFRAPEIPAHAFYPVHIRVTRILDLTDVAVREALDVGLMTLTGDWKASLALQEQDPRHRVEMHEIGQAAFALGLEGIRYPSAFDGLRHNYVLFTGRLARPPVINLPEVILTAQQLLKQRRAEGN